MDEARLAPCKDDKPEGLKFNKYRAYFVLLSDAYGQIARLIGREKNARLVGRVLSQAEYYGDYPCHRVVNHAGRLVPGWSEQGRLLEQEGVHLRDAEHADIRHFLWEG